MSLDGEYRISAVGIDALERAGVKLGLDRHYSRERAEAITQGIVGAYRQAADEARRQLGDDPFIREMVDSIEEYAADRGWYHKPFVA